MEILISYHLYFNSFSIATYLREKEKCVHLGIEPGTLQIMSHAVP